MVDSSHPKKQKRGLLSFGVLAAFGLLLPLAIGMGIHQSSPVQVGAADSESEVSSDLISFSLTSSASTETSHAFRCSITSNALEAVANSSKYNNVWSVVDDATFPTSIAIAKEECAAAKQLAEEAGEEYIAPHYNAYVYRIYNPSSGSDIVIPRTLSISDGLFYFDISAIGGDVLRDFQGKPCVKNITSITIPNTITEIETEAFVGASDIEFNLEAPDASAFPDDWTDSEHVTFNYDVSGLSAKLDLKAASTTHTFGTGADFVVGMYREGYMYPLIVEYNLLNSDGSIYQEGLKAELPLTAENADYDAVGSTVGAMTLNINVDLDVPAGYHVDDENITFHNIFPALRVPNPAGAGKITIPDLENGPLYAEARKAFAETLTFSEIFASRPGSISSFAGYTKVGLIVKRDISIYQKAMPSVYAKYKSQIESGAYAVRHQFSSLAQASYLITYDDNGTEKVANVGVSTPISQATISSTGETEVGFLINNADVGSGFSEASIKEVELCGFIVKMDLMNVEKETLINKSEISIRFSSLIIVSPDKAPTSRVNLSLVTVFVFVGYAIIYAAAAFAYYIYSKRKYRNDEFRRVNNKRFLKEAIKNGIGLGLVTGMIWFIIARWGLLNNTVVVYNPIDVFVIIFTIAGLIYIGFAIKGLVVAIKNSRKRREALRLHLGDLNADDGTK